ncbi:hypothetical protein GXW83_05385 [Streptacidiphilus sp. PB12-B1b]|uniref:hypothetical protein n=1 Tax=Streptacidiphilus sp. PB12-B1b TaxID=2705012 RepID=UPI0015FD60DA|nr:hypothetical protein [Streptacidiphilus sp. PB12-B1b]QMU75277.1 hypothetical protein GXW83_05385 [Streptacidiphilus sp. PB12-B1b]
MRGTYARARVVVIRGAVARALMWAGLVGAAAGLLEPTLTGRRHGGLIGIGLFVLAALGGLLGRRRWYARRAREAAKAPFAVTLEPPRETRLRMARMNSLWLLLGAMLTCALGLVAGPAAGLLVFGYGFGMQLAVWSQARWERAHETLLWARTEDGRLLGRRSRIGELAFTGPAAGYVRPVVRGAARRYARG